MVFTAGASYQGVSIMVGLNGPYACADFGLPEIQEETFVNKAGPVQSEITGTFQPITGWSFTLRRSETSIEGNFGQVVPILMNVGERDQKGRLYQRRITGQGRIKRQQTRAQPSSEVKNAYDVYGLVRYTETLNGQTINKWSLEGGVLILNGVEILQDLINFLQS